VLQQTESILEQLLSLTETLESIATSFHARPAEIATYNEISAAQPLAINDELVVPVLAPSSIASQMAASPRIAAAKRHCTREGG